MQTAEAPRLLPIRTLTERTSLCEMTIRRMIERGEFPRPVRVSRNRVAWHAADVDAWISARPQVAA